MSNQYSLDEIVNALGGLVVGDGSTLVRRVSSLANASTGDISFITDSKYEKALATSTASAFILRQTHAHLTTAPKIIADNPYAYFAKVSAFLNPVTVAPIGVASTAIVAVSAQVPATCSIGEFVVIGDNVV